MEVRAIITRHVKHLLRAIDHSEEKKVMVVWARDKRQWISKDNPPRYRPRLEKKGQTKGGYGRTMLPSGPGRAWPRPSEVEEAGTVFKRAVPPRPPNGLRDSRFKIQKTIRTLLPFPR